MDSQDQELEPTLKPDNVSITLLTSVVLRDSNSTAIVYGLGNDNQLYSWSGKLHKWVLA